MECNAAVVRREPVCGGDWSQLGTSKPSLRARCSDGSMVLFADLAAEQVTDGACTEDDDTVAPPTFGPSRYEGTRALDELPRGGACLTDEDCPDRRQSCDLAYAADGEGRCLDDPARASLDTSLRAPEGLFEPTRPRRDGTPCAFGFQCASGSCEEGVCGGAANARD